MGQKYGRTVITYMERMIDLMVNTARILPAIFTKGTGTDFNPRGNQLIAIIAGKYRLAPTLD